MSDTPSTSTPTWKTELNKRIEAFSSAIGVDESKAREILGELGVKDDEQSLTIVDSDEFLPFGDLRQKFVEEHKVTQIARLRMGMPHLRARTTIEEVKETNGGDLALVLAKLSDSNRPIAKWTDGELLACLDEEEDEVIKALASRTKGRPCIVFNPKDGLVNVPISLTLIRTAKKQATSRVYQHDGEAVTVRPVGEFPRKPIDESPFYPGVPLVNGYCSKSDTNWLDVDFVARVLVRVYVLHIDTGKISVQNMKTLRDAALKGEGHFRKEYSKTALIYDELAEKDALPKLKVNPDSSAYRDQLKIDTGFCK